MQNLHDTTTVCPAAGPLRGTMSVGADKSITHRALLFGALNHGVTRIVNPSQAADAIATLGMLRALHREVSVTEGGLSIGGVRDVRQVMNVTVDCGNSGTTARLAAGLLTGEWGTFTLVGDHSLLRRPMERVAGPLRALGAAINTVDGHLPMTVQGSGGVRGSHDGTMAVSSAQVHGALVLAALRSEQGLVVRRDKPMRDHTLRMARCFGVGLQEFQVKGRFIDHISPTRIETDAEIRIPGDFSSAAFMVAAALLVPGSAVRIEGVGLNPSRTAFLGALAVMGAHLRWEVTEDSFEPVGWVQAEYSPNLRGIVLGGGSHSEIPVAEMIDELPLLALIASQAQGRTIVRDAWELRVKESDRITATAALLHSLGLKVMELEDGFVIAGPQPVIGGRDIDHRDDHRLCMTAAVGALVARHPVGILRPEAVEVSYTGFWNDLRAIGGEWVRESR